MEKQRDWMDYAHLASSVVQNHQLGEIRSELSKINAAASDQMRSEMRTAVIRQVIFKLEDRFRDSRSLGKRGRFFVSKSLAGACRQLSDEPELFDEYEDRDRIMALSDKAHQAANELEKELSASELAEITQADAFYQARHFYQKAIEFWNAKNASRLASEKTHSLQQQAKAISKEIEEIDLSETMCMRRVYFRILVASLVMMGFGLPLGLAFDENSTAGWLALWAAIIGFFGAVLFALLHQHEAAKSDTTAEGTRLKQLKQEQTVVFNQFMESVRADDVALPEPIEPDANAGAYEQLFGSLKSADVPAELQTVLRERDAFIERVLGTGWETLEEINVNRLIQDAVEDVTDKFT